MVGKTIKFEDGAIQFRLRIACSILSHRPLLIRNIRSDSLDCPGLQEYEASFLRLVEQMTNGSVIEINATGTQLRFRPGILTCGGGGGAELEHECPLSRGIGWFLEGILPLAPFGKFPLNLTLHGITDGTERIDPSPDYIASSLLPLLRKFSIGTEEANEIFAASSSSSFCKVLKRGASPNGGGTVHFYCPNIREITNPLNLVTEGKIKRIRGTVTTCRLPPSTATRIAHSAKGLFHRLLPDVWIHTNVQSTSKSSSSPSAPMKPTIHSSPGLSICLTAYSTEQSISWTVETCLDPKNDNNQRFLPEDFGIKAASMLLHEIQLGGCIDSGCQALAFLFMCLGPEDVSRIQTGPLTPHAVEALRLYKETLGVEFRIRPVQSMNEEDEDDDHNNAKTLILSCMGTGYRNMARSST